MKCFIRTIKIVLASFISILLLAELLQWNAIDQHFPATMKDEHAVIVLLGLPGDNAALRAIQQWRVSMALEVRQQYHCEKIIFSGGNPSGGLPEAYQMAAIAKDLGMDIHDQLIESASNTTWENIAYSSKLIEQATLVFIVSDALHARRACNYWHQQFPNSRVHVVVADTYHFLDHFWLKIPCTLSEQYKRCKDVLRRL